MAEQQDKKMKPFFGPLGDINTYTYPGSEGRAFFTMAPVNEKGTNKSYLTGAMPVTGIQISEGVDYSLTKSLSQDFLLSAFGDAPVTIVLRGISFDEVPVCLPTTQAASGNSQQDRAMEFYDKYKLSADISNRVDIGISTTSISYRCALVNMEAQKSGEGNGNQNIYNYTLKLIGVRKK